MTQQNSLDLNTIDPSNGAKFSPNLHSFLSMRRRRHTLQYMRVYVDKDKTLWIGYFDTDCFIGNRLMQVLCYGPKSETFAYVKMKDLVEVPNFWKNYQKVGRCAIDTEHKQYFVGDDTRWSLQGDHRSCQWCGRGHQRLQQKVTQEVRTEWVPAEPATVG
jgi:hypothetical protein